MERRAALRVFSIAVLVTGALAQAQAEDPAATGTNAESIAMELAASIERFNARDPNSPDTLNTRLAFADFEAKRTDGECRSRLDAAQKQLDLAASNPALPFLPSGLARAAAADYQIHLGRASCNTDAKTRELQLRAALESAKRASDLYRDGFDAVAMGTMQFNASLAYHSLGETSSAAAMLQATIDTDREYGFADDAEDNYQLLLEWNKQASGPEAVAALMQDFPERSAVLNFAWAEGEADVAVQTDCTQLADDQNVRIQSSKKARRGVRKGLQSWIISYQPGESAINLEQLPASETLVQGTANALARVLTSLHDFVLARRGDYDDSKGAFRFAGRVRGDEKLLSRQIESMGEGSALLIRRLAPTIQVALSWEAADPRAAEDYNLETGTWIGATLDQGVWYPMTASLSLPLFPGVFLTHKMEFAYTRPVPCMQDSAALSCVEIVLRAAPDPGVLQSVLDGIARAGRLPPTQHPQLWSVAEMRLVTDPKSLQPYRLEMRRHLYWWSGKRGSNESLIQSSTEIESWSPVQKKERT